MKRIIDWAGGVAFGLYTASVLHGFYGFFDYFWWMRGAN